MRIINAHVQFMEISMGNYFDTTASKKPTNLSVNRDLLETAKKLNINISATLEEALVSKVRQYMTTEWLEENKASIGAYNQFVEQNGVFSEGLRKF